ncbi:MAG: hypothetical protein LBH16_05335 [Treponema sp.]|jgi:hypothetical protein|nr:hypothetical protein [Treponema sp.]
MLSRDDFVFTIGYDGPSAIVDGQAKKRYSSLSTKELAEKGLFRAAYSSAIWSKNPEELKTVVEVYNRISGSSISADAYTAGSSSLQRLFGVFPVEVYRAIIL